MVVEIEGVLSKADLTRIVESLASAEWTDGRQTNIGVTSDRKSNLEVQDGSPLQQQLARELEALLRAHKKFRAALIPRHFSNILISQYTAGMFYGPHYDAAIMTLPDQQVRRSDVSFTIFLSDHEAYEGGELVLDSTYGTLEYKGKAGDLIAYPTHMLHEVRPVRSGTRLAAVGWLQSHVQDIGRRWILHQLRSYDLFAQAQEIQRAYAALLQMWGEF